MVNAPAQAQTYTAQDLFVTLMQAKGKAKEKRRHIWQNEDVFAKMDWDSGIDCATGME